MLESYAFFSFGVVITQTIHTCALDQLATNSIYWAMPHSPLATRYCNLFLSFSFLLLCNALLLLTHVCVSAALNITHFQGKTHHGAYCVQNGNTVKSSFFGKIECSKPNDDWDFGIHPLNSWLNRQNHFRLPKCVSTRIKFDRFTAVWTHSAC